MRLEQLSYFVETVEKSSITAASEALHVTHQNISKSIKQLEDELQLHLLKRTREGVYLTPVGKPIYEYAKEALRSIEQIKAAAASVSFNQPIHEEVSGVITITASPAFSFMLVATIQKINLSYPNITVLYNTLEPAHVNRLLAEDALTSDIYFTCAEEGASEIKGLERRGEVTLLKKDLLKVIAKKTSPLSSYKSLSMKTFSDVPLAFYSTNHAITPLYLRLLREHGLRSKKIYQSNSTEIIQDYLYSGTVAAVSTMLTTRRPINMPENQCSLIPLNVKLAIDHLMFLPTCTKREAAFAIFMALLNDSCREMQKSL